MSRHTRQPRATWPTPCAQSQCALLRKAILRDTAYRQHCMGVRHPEVQECCAYEPPGAHGHFFTSMLVRACRRHLWLSLYCCASRSCGPLPRVMCAESLSHLCCLAIVHPLTLWSPKNVSLIVHSGCWGLAVGLSRGTSWARGVVKKPNNFFCQGQPLRTAPRDHQPPTANRTNRQPPTAANHL